MNDRYLRALRRQAVDRTPIWLMRQAGRYLPEYRQSRADAGDFMTLCKTPELACTVTLQPLRRFALDAAILFSDILTIPDAMGLGLTITDGVGPRFAQPLRNHAAIEQLPAIDPEQQLGYVRDAVRLISTELAGQTPLIGFAGSPWTLATYMVEGGSSRDFRLVKGLLHEQPASMELLLRKLTVAVVDYLNMQIAAGVQAVMLFDTWGGLLSTPDYERFSLAWMAEIVAALKTKPAMRSVPITLFTKGGSNWLEQIAATGCDAIGLDWTISLAAARRRVGARVALQGNLDPTVLLASPAKIAHEARRVLDDFGAGAGHVFNLGHGVLPQVDPDRVQCLVDSVRHYRG